MPNRSTAASFHIEFALPTLDRTARFDRERTTVEIRSVAVDAAPVVLVVEPPDPALQAIEVRSFEGRLFAPLRPTNRSDSAPDVRWSAHQMLDGFSLTLAARIDASGWPGLEVLMPDKVFGARSRVPAHAALALRIDPSLLRGDDLADQMRTAAARDFVMVDHVVHRAVGDPVWAESPDVPGLLILTVPIDPDHDGMLRVRHDFPLLAETLAERRHAEGRRRRAFAPARRGRLTVLSESYLPRRDDAACCARDFLFSVTGALVPLLHEGAFTLSDRTVSAWFAARQAGDACMDRDPASIRRCFAAGLTLAESGLADMEEERKRIRVVPDTVNGAARSGLRRAVRDCALRRQFLHAEYRMEGLP